MKQKIITFICIFLGVQLLIYFCWAFVEMSFSKPLIDTFTTKKSRTIYLFFISFLFLFSDMVADIYIESNKKKH